MDIHPDKTIAGHRESLLRGMREYMGEAEPPYKEAGITECAAILDQQVRALAGATDATAALALTRETVLALNALNSRCDGQLIETDQREKICLLLMRAGSLRGFNEEDDDITEEWREW